ncbi:hypothetical protein ACQP2X_08550 [Actinoplanes sp. CA-131856]
MEPTAALRSIETALRLLICDVLGSPGWLAAPGAPSEDRLRERQAEEAKRRDGATASQNLIDYTETYHLTTLVVKNWEKFQPALNDKARTVAYFGIINDVRNSVAHSRDLVSFERDLISGIAGHLRNQISLYRSTKTASARYYPLIEDLRDSFGREGQSYFTDQAFRPVIGPRIEVGDILTFMGTAFNAKGRRTRWEVRTSKHYHQFTAPENVVAEGDSVSFDYLVKSQDVDEKFIIDIRIVADSKYHRVSLGDEAYDDIRIFTYSVNPPPDED